MLLKHDFRLKILSCHSAFERSDQDASIDAKKEGSYKVLCAKLLTEIEFSKGGGQKSRNFPHAGNVIK